MRVPIRCNGLFAVLIAIPLGAASVPALAQVNLPPAANDTAAAPKQVVLTQKTIDQLIAAQKAINDARAKAPKDIDAKGIQAKVDSIAKGNGFTTTQELTDTSYSLSVVLAGMDDSGNYIGTKAALQKQIDEVKADPKMAANEKKEMLDELNEALKLPETEKPSQANIDVVKSNFSKIAEVVPHDE